MRDEVPNLEAEYAVHTQCVIEMPSPTRQGRFRYFLIAYAPDAPDAYDDLIVRKGFRGGLNIYTLDEAEEHGLPSAVITRLVYLSDKDWAGADAMRKKQNRRPGSGKRLPSRLVA
ncbi:MAG: hypothetical protein ACOZAO_04145 [Patescibacteria group bacterium]